MGRYVLVVGGWCAGFRFWMKSLVGMGLGLILYSLPKYRTEQPISMRIT